MALDETIAENQAGHIADHEQIATVLNDANLVVNEGWRRPEAYGPIGATDDAAPKIQQALTDVLAASDAGYTPGGVELGGRRYYIGSELSVVSGRTPIRGQGGQSGATELFHHGAYRGALMSLESPRGGEAAITSTTFDRGASQEGAAVSNIMFCGDRAMSGHASGLRTVGTCDSAWLKGLSFRYLNGTALTLGDNAAAQNCGAVREGKLDWIEIRGCGNGDTYPTMLITIKATGTGDGTNQLSFQDFQAPYNYGPILIKNDHATETIRRIVFGGRTMLHGLAHAGVSDSEWDLLQIIGDVSSISIDNLITNGSSGTNVAVPGTPDYAIIRTKASTVSAKYPSSLRIGWSQWSTSYGDMISVEKLNHLILEGWFSVSGGGWIGKSLRIASASGLIDGDVLALGIGGDISNFSFPDAATQRKITMRTGNTLTTPNELGFYGAAPIVKPAALPAASTDLPTAIALANDLRTKLISLGLLQ